MRLPWDVASILKVVCVFFFFLSLPVAYVVKCWLVGYVVNNELEGVKHSGFNLF
jgi:hypothetical protein